MSERPAPTPEANPAITELAKMHAEKQAELNEAFKTTPETAPEAPAKRAEKAREVISLQAERSTVPQPIVSPAPLRINMLSHHLNYAQTLASVQRKLPAVSRRFSQAIHTPAVEKTSELLESTVARPSVLLGTTWTALLVGTIFYLVARHYGYALSGSELLFSFIVGALIGITSEGILKLLRHR